MTSNYTALIGEAITLHNARSLEVLGFCILKFCHKSQKSMWKSRSNLNQAKEVGGQGEWRELDVVDPWSRARTWRPCNALRVNTILHVTDVLRITVCWNEIGV